MQRSQKLSTRPGLWRTSSSQGTWCWPDDYDLAGRHFGRSEHGTGDKVNYRKRLTSARAAVGAKPLEQRDGQPAASPYIGCRSLAQLEPGKRETYCSHTRRKVKMPLQTPPLLSLALREERPGTRGMGILPMEDHGRDARATSELMSAIAFRPLCQSQRCSIVRAMSINPNVGLSTTHFLFFLDVSFLIVKCGTARVQGPEVAGAIPLIRAQAMELLQNLWRATQEKRRGQT